MPSIRLSALGFRVIAMFSESFQFYLFGFSSLVGTVDELKIFGFLDEQT